MTPSITSYAFEAQQTMSVYGKSFFLARRFLNAQQAKDTAILYAFCRYVDDVADECLNPLEQLQKIETDLLNRVSLIPPVQSYLELSERLNLPMDVAMVLIKTLQKDVKGIRIADQKELIRYCYGVASTVGILMCCVLGVKKEEALPFAIDLGIGMQLTNISRDVYEDAEADKIYLPSDAFLTKIDSLAIVDEEPETLGQVKKATISMLKLAERYYQSADQGIHYLPAKARLAILLASRLYKAKGDKILKNPAKYLLHRADTSLWQKICHTIKAIYLFIFHPLYKKGAKSSPHDPQLHQAIDDLPSAHRFNYEK
jgi:15-cis-phytoene synthase